jgi:hypothetical protein
MRKWTWLGLALLLSCKDGGPVGVCRGDGDCPAGKVCTSYSTCVDPIDLPPGSQAPGSCAEALPPARCGLPDGPHRPITDPGMRDVLPGRWLRCSGTSLFDRREVGLEFTQDGAWYRLVATGDGRIQRRSDVGDLGKWSAEDVGLNWQLNLGGLGGSIPAFVQSPLKMRLGPPDIAAIYLYAPTADCTAGPAPDAGPEAPAAGPCVEPLPPFACEQASTLRVSITDQSLRTLFPGRWLYCGGLRMIATDAIGFEALSDGRWYRLTTDAQGRLIRAAGFDAGGRWETLRDADQVQVDMRHDSGGVSSFHAEFRDNPRNLFAIGVGTSSRYVEAPPSRCP